MGDWTDIFFTLKPTPVDQGFLEKMDACFAAAGYLPISIGVVGHPGKEQIPVSHRLAAMDEADFHTSVYDPDGERLTSAFLGYSASGANDGTLVHIWIIIHETERYVDWLKLMSHTNAYFFRPDYEDDGCEWGEDVRRMTEDSLVKVSALRKVVPVIHRAFGAYYTEATDDTGFPLFLIADSKLHTLPFQKGEDEDNLTLWEALDGRWICPVCGEPDLAKPPWFDSGLPGPRKLQASFETCPTCRTQFGVDDTGIFRPWSENRPDTWSRLQRRWLKQTNSKRLPSHPSP